MSCGTNQIGQQDAIVRIYGNRDLPEGTPDRPLVTFALFAYNQEKYIREAVEGALAQTYSPLEIILSDDCSTDKTFEIMEDMAKEYKGHHRIITRSNSFNIGTALHVQTVFFASSGKLFVVAAGDDISHPDRTTAMTEAWVIAGCPEGVVHSGREVFHNGTNQDKPIKQVPANRNRYSENILEGYTRGYWLPAAAPTCAYTRGVFEKFEPLNGGGLIEDAPLQLRAALIGRFIHCDRSLVRQRLHNENTGTGYSVHSPARWNRFMQSKIIAFRTMQRDLARGVIHINPKIKQKIERRILAVIQSASCLMISEIQPIGYLEGLALAFKIANSPAIGNKFHVRVAYALTFFGYTFHRSLRTRICMLLDKSLRE